MPRAIWSGTIAFGLVSVPVRMESAVQEHKLHFNFVHEPDGGRIGYQKVCKKEDKPVDEDEVVKAFEIRKGKWVYLEDEDFKDAALDQAQKTIEIQAFVEQEEIDPIFFERTYYLSPQDGGEKVYTLLARVMDKSGLVGVATFVMRDRQHLGCLRIRDGVITLERMHFADEIRPAKGLAPKGVRVDQQEMKMATQLVNQFTGRFQPEKFKDTYRDTLVKIIKAKEKGETVPVAEEEQPEAPIDLMDALRASVKAKKGGGRSKPRKAKRKAA